MSHTTGPWAVWESPYGGARIHARHEVTIADVMSRGLLTAEEFKANARLIAASPQLLEALRSLLKHHECRDCTSAFHAENVSDARAAIARATGKVAGATNRVAAEQTQQLTEPTKSPGQPNGHGGKAGEAPGKSAHSVQWSGTYRGTDEGPRETGWCAACGHDVYDGESGHTGRTHVSE